MTPVLSDEGLVRRVKQGDRASFDQLMQRYQQEVIAVAFRMLWNHEEAVELAQEAFFRMWRGFPRFREQASFRTWAYQITFNLVRNRRRWYARHRVSQTVSLDLHEENDEEGPPVVAQVSDSAPNPREEAARQESRARIEQAVAQLPLALKTVVVLRDMQGLPYERIANICGERVGTVKSRLHRARAMLRTALGGIR